MFTLLVSARTRARRVRGTQILSAILFFGAALAASAQTLPGDRNLQRNEVYPQSPGVSTVRSLLIQNGGRLYNVKNPPSGRPAAVGNGVTDDTAALRSAIDYIAEKNRAAGIGEGTDFFEDIYTIYIPNGTYLVSNSLHYTGNLIKDNALPGNPTRGGFQGLQIVGQSRESTIIKVASSSTAFNNSASPAPVLSWSRWDIGEEFNNWPAKAKLANLTIDTSNKPGAIGLDFYGANNSRIDNIRLIGAGPIGLHIRVDTTHGYYSNIIVDGFALGIAVKMDHANGVSNMSFEYVTLQNQTQAGIYADKCSSNFRKIFYNGAAPAVKVTNDPSDTTTWQPMVVLTDSDFISSVGGNSNPAIDIATNAHAFVRGVTTSGFNVAIRKGGATAVAGPSVSEYLPGPITSYSAQRVRSGDTRSLNLPVEEWPVMSWQANFANWAVVDEYQQNGESDTVAAQAALNSGALVVVFKRLSYNITSTLTVPYTVKRILGMGTTLTGSGTKFNVNGVGSDPLIFDNINFNGDINHSNNRTALYEMPRAVSISGSTSPSRHTVFVNGGGYIVRGGPSQQLTNVDLFARWYNVELATDWRITAGAGSRAWIFGLKTEKLYSTLRAQNGGMLEVLGVNLHRVNQPGGTRTAIGNFDSHIGIVGATSSNPSHAVPVNWTNLIQDTQAGVTKTWVLSNTAFPERGPNTITSGPNKVIPLYVSYTPSAVPPPTPAGLAATGGNSQVSLSWNAAAAATSYSVKRSLNVAGPFTTIGSATGTSYSDVGLTNGTTYHYVVAAVNAAGSSVPAEPVSATPALPAGTLNAIRVGSGTSVAIPTIDGNPSDSAWSFNTTASKLVSGTNGNTVTVATAWDSTKLYVAIKVLDSALRNDSTNSWDDDSVEVYIDANHNHGTSFDAFDRQFVKGWSDSAFFEKNGNTTGVTHAVGAITGGYVVELSIPWSNLNVTPTAGGTIGFDVANNDDSNGGSRDGQLVWRGTLQNFTNTSGYGDLFLQF